MNEWSADGLSHVWRELANGRLEANCKIRIELVDGVTTISLFRIEDGTLVGEATTDNRKFGYTLRCAVESLLAEAYRNRPIISNWKKRKETKRRGTVEHGKET